MIVCPESVREECERLQRESDQRKRDTKRLWFEAIDRVSDLALQVSTNLSALNPDRFIEEMAIVEHAYQAVGWSFNGSVVAALCDSQHPRWTRFRNASREYFSAIESKQDVDGARKRYAPYCRRFVQWAVKQNRRSRISSLLGAGWNIWPATMNNRALGNV